MNTETMKAKINILDVSEKYLGISHEKNIPCPIHGGDNQTAFSIRESKQIARCHTGHCNNGKGMDIFALTQAIHNVDFTEAKYMLKRDFLGGEHMQTQKQEPIKQESVPMQTQMPKNYKSFYETLSLDTYFINRGIAGEVIGKYNLMMVGDNTDLTAFNEKEKYVLKHFNKQIIPISDKHFIARLDPSLEGHEKTTRYINFGDSAILNAEYISDASKSLIFVTEGALDAFSIETLGYHAIALNSVSNANKLIKAIQSNEDEAREKDFILLPDNDKAGEQLTKELEKKFKDMNISLYVHRLQDHKDINEVLVADKDLAEQVINNAVDKCLNSGTVDDVLATFFADPQKVETIQIEKYPQLNQFIGGLRPALYVVGAGSSFGKTTLVQNIADDIAAQGQHVLFFSLEMGIKELVAKSLVSVMGEKHLLKKQELINKMKVKIDDIRGQEHNVQHTLPNVISSRDILSGDIYDKDSYYVAVGEYSKRVGKNLTIREGMFDITVKTIRKEVERHIRRKGKKPLVIVDYLQILQPLDKRMSDKQNTDTNVSELKRISRDLDVPVIAISSFNRNSYREKPSFASFKESGAIEYGADVVITLSLHVDEEDKDVELDQIKARPIKDIDLTVLKNRFGVPYKEFKYRHIGAMNIMMEVPLDELYKEQEEKVQKKKRK